MIFQERLKRLRKDKGITQEQLAVALNIPPTTIRRLETSNSIPRRERLGAIADYFSVSIDYLLGQTDDPYPVKKKSDIAVKTEPATSGPRDYHIMDSDGVQFIARSDKNLSPEAYKKMQELAKKAAEIFEEKKKDE